MLSYAGLARFGTFFAVDEVRGDRDGWSPVAALSDPAVLQGRVRLVADALAAGLPDDRQVPVRVAASVTQLGLCARLSAVALAAAVDGLPVPMIRQLVYRDELGGPYPVGLIARPFEKSAPWPAALLELVGPIAEATIATFPLSPRVVWGNVASGVNGAARMIQALHSRGEARLAVASEALLDQALAHGSLHNTLTAGPESVRRRRSCCLIYRLTDSTSAVCGDCVLENR